MSPGFSAVCVGLTSIAARGGARVSIGVIGGCGTAWLLVRRCARGLVVRFEGAAVEADAGVDAGALPKVDVNACMSDVGPWLSALTALYGDASGQFGVSAVMGSEDVAVGSVVPVIGPDVAVLALSILPELAPILASLCAGSCNFSGVGTGR